MRTKFRIPLILAVALLIGAALFSFFTNNPERSSRGFDGARALEDARAQMDLGPRVPGSEAHQEAAAYIRQELGNAGWNVELQQTVYNGHPVINVIAKRGTGPWLILGAHYDSRMAADQDPDPAKWAQAVPAANDGASGVAVLLELARAIPKDLQQEVWLVFFDAEDQGDLPGWDWILGSSAFADSLGANSLPDAVVILDMIGDADLNIYMERNSDPALTKQIWDTAASLGYTKYFIQDYKFSMLDDHTPFLRRGIPAVDIIDFDYPYWHTTQDTMDKISSTSLDIVGDAILQWIINR